MNCEEKILFKKLILVLCEEYNHELSKPRLKLWEELLKDYEYSSVEAAIGNAILECSYFPRVSDIQRFLMLQHNPTLKSAEAWADLRAGLSSSKIPEDPITRSVVWMMGGVRSLSQCPLRDLDFKRKTFIDLYEAELANSQHKRLKDNISSKMLSVDEV